MKVEYPNLAQVAGTYPVDCGYLFGERLLVCNRTVAVSVPIVREEGDENGLVPTWVLENTRHAEMISGYYSFSVKEKGVSFERMVATGSEGDPVRTTVREWNFDDEGRAERVDKMRKILEAMDEMLERARDGKEPDAVLSPKLLAVVLRAFTEHRSDYLHLPLRSVEMYFGSPTDPILVLPNEREGSWWSGPVAMFMPAENA